MIGISGTTNFRKGRLDEQTNNINKSNKIETKGLFNKIGIFSISKEDPSSVFLRKRGYMVSFIRGVNPKDSTPPTPQSPGSGVHLIPLPLRYLPLCKSD
jgi:hypothetical protein